MRRKGESKDGSIAGITIGLFDRAVPGWGADSVPNSVAVEVYGGDSALTALIFDGPATLSEGMSRVSNGFCDFSLAMVSIMRCCIVRNKQWRTAGSYCQHS